MRNNESAEAIARIRISAGSQSSGTRGSKRDGATSIVTTLDPCTV